MKDQLIKIIIASIMMLFTLPSYSFFVYKNNRYEITPAAILHGDSKKNSVTLIYSEPISIGSRRDYEIPEKVYDGANREYTVRVIGSNVFANKHMTSLTLPSTIQNIDAGAFAGCTIEEPIEIPEQLTIIGESAFANSYIIFKYRNNPNLVDLSNCIEIGARAFSGSNLKSVKLGDGIRVIGASAFASSTLRSITFPETDFTIGDHVFDTCKYLEEINLGSNIGALGPWFFCNCTSLKSITIPSSVKSIGRNTFYGCSSLVSIELPNSIESIDYGAFSECSSLVTIEIPNSVEFIGEDVFSNCTSLESFILPDHLTELPQGIFRCCSSLKNVKIPEGIKSIGNSAFSECTGLEKISFPLSLEKIGFQAFKECFSNLQYYSPQYLHEVTIPSNVNTIDAQAFIDCEGIGSLTISGNNALIGSKAFRGCKNLHSVIIGDMAEYPEIPKIQIKDRAFTECPLIKNLSLSYCVKSIDEYAFSEIAAESIIIPSSIQFLSSHAFSRCFKLKEIYYPSTHPCQSTIEPGIGESYRDIKLYVPVGSREDIIYTPIEPWKYYNVIEYNFGIEKIKIESSRNAIEVGDSLALSTVIYPSGATNKTLIWSSDNEKIATVSEDGIVSGLNIGTATITASSTDMSETKENYDIVVDFTKSIKLNTSTVQIQEGDSIQINATIMPENAINKHLKWESNEEYIANVNSDGLIKAVRVGKCTISVSPEDGLGDTQEIEVTVTPVPVDSILLSRTSWHSTIGDVVEIRATVYPENATNKKLKWSSSSPYIAKVDQNDDSSIGLVSAEWPGTCVISVSAEDGSGVTSQCQVDIDPIFAKYIMFTSGTDKKARVGEKIWLCAHVRPDKATYRRVSWSANGDAEIMFQGDSYDSKYDRNEIYVTGLKPGNVTIKATAIDSQAVADSINLTILPPLIDSIRLSANEMECIEGEQLQISPSISPEYAPFECLKWSSSDENIAMVNENGLITALKYGECLITVTATDGSDVSASCKIIVKPRLAESIDLDYSEWNGMPGDTFTISADVNPDNATNKTLLWSSTDETVAIVNGHGMVTALSVGECIITATATDGSDVSASCKVVVKPRLAESIDLDYSEWNGMPGDTFTISATVNPYNTTDKTVIWTSSNPEVANVDDEGVVTAIGIGSTTITATTVNGLSASCEVTVLPVIAQFIELNIESADLEKGETLLLIATITPYDTTDKTVTWTSSNPEVATVDENGLVTALGVGSSTITATTVNGLTATCEVTVLPVLVEAILLDPNMIQGLIGESFTIVATILPENASNTHINWESSNPNVASVDQNGNVEINKEGSCRIIAYATDGSNVSGECFFTGTSGIESIFAECGEHISIYTTGGLLIKKDCKSDDLKNLVPGVYIFKSEKKTISVIIP
ncbi:MAG: Ig-like domain-containing protein [Muribaculaceae bacterium]|nr:Ig-like domain-containing protein [Muribaculaceae bacterium]